RHEVPVILVVVRWAVVRLVLSCPQWLEVQPGDDLHAGGVARAHDAIRFGPVELTSGNRLDLAPLEESLLPVEASASGQLQVALGGGWLAPDEGVHAVVQIRRR